MITLFKNKEKNTYFFVDPKARDVSFISPKDVNVFFKYKTFFDLQILELPDYKTVLQFKRAIKNRILDNIDLSDIAFELKNHYPEYFI